MKMLMLSDAELVRDSLAGETDAFAAIVERYKGLVSGVAYHLTGSLAESEELAQEVFVTAWRELRSLREPAKLRSWICGIARNIGASKARRKGEAALKRAVSLEEIADRPASDPAPAEALISREEERLMWRALEQVPESYREPLILFYREQCSIEHVAEALGLSIDTAKQRLSRGRKMLQEEVAVLVESTLQRSIPGRAFTLGVLSALPLWSGSAAAATVASSTVKGSALGNTAAVASWIGMIAGPLVGILAAWLGVKASLRNARSEEERQMIMRWTMRMIFFVLGSIVVMLAATGLAVKIMPHSVPVGVALLTGVPLAYVILLFAGIRRCNRALDAIRAGALPAQFPSAVSSIYEWRTKTCFLGLPLVHIRSGKVPGQPRRAAVGWIALGDLAVGVLFAAGGMAVGGISMGGLAAGLLPIGGAAAGLLALGGLSLGWMSLGGLALGYYALGGVSVAWKAAFGGLAVAADFALGGMAVAAHANDQTAQEAIEQMPFFVRAIGWMKNSSTWQHLIWTPVLLVILQVMWFSRKNRRGSGNS